MKNYQLVTWLLAFLLLFHSVLILFDLWGFEACDVGYKIDKFAVT